MEYESIDDTMADNVIKFADAKKKIEGPQPHEEYLHNLGNLTPYNKELRKKLKVKAKKTKDGKLDADDLIKKVMDAASELVGKHYGDKEDVHFKIDYETLARFIEEHEKDILKDGEIGSDALNEIVGTYVQRANSYIANKYGQRLSQSPIEEAKESLFHVAKFLGKEHHKPHIDRTTKIQTLISRMERHYHNEASQKTGEMHKEDQYVKKKGFNDYINYKEPEKKQQLQNAA